MSAANGRWRAADGQTIQFSSVSDGGDRELVLSADWTELIVEGVTYRRLSWRFYGAQQAPDAAIEAALAAKRSGGDVTACFQLAGDIVLFIDDVVQLRLEIRGAESVYRASEASSSWFEIRVERQGMIAELGKMVGAIEELQSGNVALDDAALIRAAQPARAALLIGRPEVQRGLLALMDLGCSKVVLRRGGSIPGGDALWKDAPSFEALDAAMRALRSCC